MSGYTPGEQPAAMQRVVKLNTNENPYPPSPKVISAIRELEAEMLRRYPNPTADSFRDAAARLWNLPSRNMILAGNGSDDILTIATRTFIPPGGKLAYPTPTYSLYPVLASLQEAQVVTVEWEKDYELPTQALLSSGANAIYLANPNAPTGTFVSPMKIAALARAFNGVVLVDEAYGDFADDNCVGLVSDHANIVISRTLSKAYSLAGLRFGYAIANEAVIEQMMKVKDSYNCDAISIAAATAAIGDQEYAQRTWTNVRAERQRVTSELTQMGWMVLPSSANFILAAPPDGRGEAVYQGLKRQGILVRYFNQPHLSDKVRITIGTSQENNALLSGIRAITLADKAA